MVNMKMNLVIFAIFAIAACLFANDTFVFVKEFNGSLGKGEMNFSFITPNAIVIGDDGLLYVGDTGLGGVYALNSADKVVKTIGKSGGASEFSIISDVKYFGGLLYIADRGANRVYNYVEGSGISEIGPPRALLLEPASIWMEDKVMWVLNTKSNRITEFNTERSYLEAEHLSYGIGDGKINGAKDFAFDSEYIYVADTQNYRIEILNRSFGFVKTIGTGSSGVILERPMALAVDFEGRIFVSDWINDRIVVFDINGNVLDTFGKEGKGIGEFNNPGKMSFAKNGTLYILDTGNKRVVAYNLNWSANDQSFVNSVYASELKVLEYRQNIIDVMDMIGASYSQFSSATDITTAKQYLEQKRYSDAKALADKAVDKLEQRRAIDVQTLDTKLQEKAANSTFDIDFYSGKLGLEEERTRVEMAAKLDAAKAALKSANYGQSANLLIQINNWIVGIDAKFEEQKNNPPTTPTEPPQTTQEVIVKNKAANLRVRMESLQTRAEDAYVYAGFETAGTLIDTSLELAKIGAYDDATQSLENAQIKLDEIETRVDTKEKEIKSAAAELNLTGNKIREMGIDLNSSSASAQEMAGAWAILNEEPQKAKTMAVRALEYAQTESSQKNEMGYALAAVAGAFVAIVAIGAVAAFYIMKRNESRRNTDVDVNIKFARTEDEKRKGKGKNGK